MSWFGSREELLKDWRTVGYCLTWESGGCFHGLKAPCLYEPGDAHHGCAHGERSGDITRAKLAELLLMIGD